MQIEHVNLVVANAHQTMDFLKIAFPHWEIRGSDAGEWYGKPRHWYHFGDNQSYFAISDHGEGAPRDLEGHSQGLAHIGFVVDDLDGIMARYEAHNIEPSSALREESARRNVYYIDPQGLELEFVQYSSDQPSMRNDYRAVSLE